MPLSPASNPTQTLELHELEFATGAHPSGVRFEIAARTEPVVRSQVGTYTWQTALDTSVRVGYGWGAEPLDRDTEHFYTSGFLLLGVTPLGESAALTNYKIFGTEIIGSLSASKAFFSSSLAGGAIGLEIEGKYRQSHAEFIWDEQATQVNRRYLVLTAKIKMGVQF